MRLRKTGKVLAILVSLYLLFPLVAGVLAIGDRDGPKIYPIAYHTMLYMIAYEDVHHEKPRQTPWLERPWFYGFPRRPRTNASSVE